MIDSRSSRRPSRRFPWPREGHRSPPHPRPAGHHHRPLGPRRRRRGRSFGAGRRACGHRWGWRVGAAVAGRRSHGRRCRRGAAGSGDGNSGGIDAAAGTGSHRPLPLATENSKWRSSPSCWAYRWPFGPIPMGPEARPILARPEHDTGPNIIGLEPALAR